MKTLRQILEINLKDRPLESESLNNSLKNHYGELHKTNPAIKDYTNYGYNIINKHLWAQHSKQKPPRNKNVKIMDKTLADHKTPHEIQVYSGIRYDPRKVMNEEGVVHHPGYLSTSLTGSTARHFASSRSPDPTNLHILSIKIPKGHPGVYIPDYEREFILPRGSKLRHTGKVDVNSITNEWTGNISNVNIHHMEII